MDSGEDPAAQAVNVSGVWQKLVCYASHGQPYARPVSTFIPPLVQRSSHYSVRRRGICIDSDDAHLPGIFPTTQDDLTCCGIVWIEIRAPLLVAGCNLSTVSRASDRCLAVAVAM